MRKYVVAIKLKDGTWRYLSVHTNSGTSLIKHRSSATLFEHERVARILSDWFWEKHWQKSQYDIRAIEGVKTR